MQKPNGSFVKKVFAAGLAVTTALWASAGLFVAATAAVEAHPAGSLVLSGSTVWHVSDDGTGRHGIDSLAKFYSHRYSFANVVPANSADLALPDLGLLGWGNGVLFLDGGTVYQVSGNTKHGFTSAANFTGNGFKFSNVVNASLAGVSAGSNIDSTTAAHMEGTFVLSGGTVWKITATGRMGIPSPAVLFSHGGTFAEIVPANAADLAKADEGVAKYRAGALVNDSGTVYAVTATTKRGFPSASCFTGFGFNFGMLVAGSTSGLTAGTNFCADSVVTPPPTSSGSLSVSLASDTPAATTVVENAARVGYTKVSFTAGASDVVIDSMVAERVGIAADSNFTDIILLDVTGAASVGTALQIGTEKTLGTTHQVTFNDDITVKAGQTKSLLLAANMAATMQTGEQAALQLNSVTLAGTATLSGTLPIKGSTMTMNGSLAIGTATIAAGGSDPAATTQQVGTNDYIVSSVRVTAGSVEDVEIQQFRFYQNGTAADGDVKDLELVHDAKVVATVAKPASKEAIFKLATPIVIKKGENKEFSLRLDIADGSSRTISFDFEKKTDVVALGKTYGYYITPTYPNSTTPFYNANNTTIDVGTLTFSKGVVSSLNVGEGVNNQVIGAFKTTVQGEPVQVTRLVLNLSVSGTGNGADITNVVVKDDAGKVVAGPFDGADNTGPDAATTTDTIVFPVGTKTFTVEANLNTDFAANDTIQVQVDDPDSKVTAKGTVTNQTITANPTSTVNLDTMTVKSGALLVSTSATPAAQSVVIGKQDFVFANFVVDASTSGEDVRVTQLLTVHKTAANSTQSNISNLEVLVDGVSQPPLVQPTATAATTATSTFSFTNPIVVKKGESKTLVLRGDVNAGTGGTDTHSFGCNGSACMTVTGATTATSVTPTVTNSDGQTMSLVAAGTLTIADDASDPNAGAITGGSEKVTVGVLNITAGQEALDLTEILLGASAVNGGALNDEFTRVYLFDGSTQIASAVPTTTAAITFQNIPSGTFRINVGTPKKLTIKVDVGAVSDPSNPSSAISDSGDGVNFTVGQDAYAAKGVDSGTSLAAGSKSGAFTGSEFTVYKSLPTWSQVTFSDTLVNGSGQRLFKFKIAADAKGDVGFYKAAFGISTSTATVTAFSLIEEPGTSSEVNVTNNATRSVGANLVASSGGTGGQNEINIFFDTGTDGVGNGGEFRSIAAGTSKTYELRGNVANSSSGSSVSVVFRGDSAFTSTYPDAGGGATAGDNTSTGISGQDQGRFVWSDLVYASASSTATNTAEWFNGFRVPGLTTTSTAQTVSR